MSDGREPETRCPVCGAPAERGQLVCLECGSRVALAYRRPPSWKLPVAIALIVAALAVAGAIVAYGAVSDGARDEVAAKPLQVERRAAGKARPTKAAAGAISARGGIYGWPRDLAAYTVVLVSNGDRASAVRFARGAAGRGNPDRVGVLRADDFKGLPRGFYIVFAGQYPSRASAQAAAERLGKRFQGAFPQRVAR